MTYTLNITLVEHIVYNISSLYTHFIKYNIHIHFEWVLISLDPPFFFTLGQVHTSPGSPPVQHPTPHQVIKGATWNNAWKAYEKHDACHRRNTSRRATCDLTYTPLHPDHGDSIHTDVLYDCVWILVLYDARVFCSVHVFSMSCPL